MIVELSENGFGFVSGRSLSVGEELTVAWRFDDAEAPMQIFCVVRYTEKSNGTNSCMTGAEFLDIGVADRLRIVDFLTRRILSPPV